MRTAQEIRAHFVELLEAAVRRPGMFLGEVLLREFVESLAFIDGDDAGWAGMERWFRDRGLWSTTGVAGRFRRRLGSEAYREAAGHAFVDDQVASVYAELAYGRGLLRIDRLLDAARLDLLATEELPGGIVHPSTLVERNGAPSLGRTASTWPTTLTYASADPSRPFVSFDFWGDAKREPVLVARRSHRTSLADDMTLTPAGEVLMARERG